MTGRDDFSRRVKLTYDDFVHFQDDGMRHELIDGEHYVTPSPNTRHQRISRRLLVAIANWLAEHPVGEIFSAPFDVVFTRFDVVEPDLLYVSAERAQHALTEQHALGADLVVEIVSPGTRRRDDTIKRHLYEREGVSEYWQVDPERNMVRIHRRAGDRFAPSTLLATDRVLTTPLLPGFELSLESLFRD